MPEEINPATADQQPGAEPDRSAQPVDSEEAPRLPFPIVGVGASAGGIEAFGEFLNSMRPDSGIAFVFILHLPPDAHSHLADIFSRRTAMPVQQVEDGMAVQADHVYVIRPGHVLTVRGGRLRLGPELGGARAANRPVDDFFRSLAEEQRERAVCIILSGMGSNGTAGAQAVKAVGGLCIAQDPESAQYPSMPRHLVDAGYADHVLRPSEIPDILLAYAGSPYANGSREADAAPVLDREGHHLREVLAVLRTRTKQDFTGYKKATLLRRVQRRMGLARLTSLGEYAKLLRQTPAEVIALADDLLIHVTGFFRDPEAWEALHRHVVVPLIAGREAGSPVRAWVAACSSGEEAYSLAILLMEESERAGKPLDIKVFATDLADRTLAHARAGVYPGGIESEISPGRLERFFVREAEVYRVRADPRDRVVFAPQNILSDPPFSRLDIATCRNLLIYLEPEVQKRVLNLLHFGLRVGGAMFLGSSETAAGTEGLFEVIDKKARIFRRVGPTRHGMVDFPLPNPITGSVESGSARGVSTLSRLGTRDAPTQSIAELSRHVILNAHSPPAVTVDRDGRIVYYHGDAVPYVRLTGEPTRELLLIAREGILGALRSALQRAGSDHTRVTVPGGWVERESGRRHRVDVTASPVIDPSNPDHPAPYFVVSFVDHGEIAVPGADGSPNGNATWEAEVRRLRGELQGTIEELQTSNEELKASNEEVTSVNEELQSANEELETSKEEMQSLNEELSTVNSQLRVKMEEHQAAASDLGSLLASTDIAVLFLDTSLRIRRFTPAARDLMDLIPGDIGRPAGALARRFEDPAFDADCQAVLERLATAQHEVPGADGRHYLRRATPYRTTDNRIDGVVITFVDITARKRAEDAVQASERRLLRMVNVPRVGVLTFELSGALIHANDAFLEIIGYVRDEFESKARTWHDFTPPEYVDAGGRIMEELRTRGRGGPYEKEYIRKDGSRVWLMFVAADLGDGTIAGYAIDISDRKQTEAALRASEEQFRRAIEDAPIAVIMQTEDGQVLQVSRTWTELTGYALADVPTADAWLTRAYGPGANAVRTHMHELFRGTRKTLDVQFAIRTRSGNERHWSFSASAPGTLLDGRRFLVGMAVDITDRQNAEIALRESEKRLRLALAAARMGIWTLDVATGTQTRDANLNALLGLDAVDTTQPFDEFLTHVHPEDWAAVQSAFAVSAREGQPLRVEFRVVWPDGSVRWLRDQGDVFGTSVGPEQMAGACVDVTERREAEQALRGSEERLRLILESATDFAILTLAPDRTVTTWSPGAAATFGYASDEIVGRSGDTLFTPEDRAGGAPEKEVQQALRSGRAEDERWHVRKDQSRFYASGVMRPLRDGDGLVKVARDLTGRKRMEDEVRDARDRLEERVAERTAELERALDALEAEMGQRRILTQRLGTAQEEERRRLSRDLHDTAGQLLGGLSLAFKAIEARGDLPPTSAGQFADARKLTNDLARELHALSVRLRPTSLDDIGLEAALGQLVSEWSSRSGVRAAFQPGGLTPTRLSPEIETTIYRIVQEALTNIAKHAEAKNVDVVVTKLDDFASVVVEDDGSGFDPGVTPNGRLGLLEMRERVEMLGGTMDIDSAVGSGTTIAIQIPISREGGS